jgi:endonuclease YncB( thermonuclease family)
VQKSGEQKTGIAGIHAITSFSEGLGGFESITDARLAEGEPVAGDRFQVVHEGRILPVRLLWVNCAPVDETDSGVKAFAKYFGIDDEDAVAIGRFAREFTAGYLRDKPLRLLIRPDPDKDGTLAALVFLPDVGLYQNVLVDHGLAAIAPPPRESRRNATEKALLTTLEARESAAKKRKSGAWALAAETEGGKKP